MPSALWSSLFTLDKLRNHVSVSPDPSRTYQSLEMLPTGTDDETKKEYSLNQRHQTLCTSIAFIGASDPDVNSVTACSVEITPYYSRTSGDELSDLSTVVVLRLAQNTPVNADVLSTLQNMVQTTVEEVQKHIDQITVSEEDVKDSKHSVLFPSNGVYASEPLRFAF
jgi:hypothetical protein